MMLFWSSACVKYIDNNCVPQDRYFYLLQCLSSPCLNGGTCFTLDESNTPRCACTEEWTGQTCAQRGKFRCLTALSRVPQENNFFIL